ncbi:hypothetical protein [Enterobacter hormaechei]|uniref:hypothetical protein n=1 Tax=Enterobacter hormaechei TaxID=158836 RepID=UPI000E2FEF29|nr:hypothetical protein [Enterobacter hormaechei]
MNVKRYEWVACDEHACHCDVVESAEGDMVDYEDYAALEARCAALAAENAGLKESRKNLAEFIHEELDADYPLNMDIKTTATDAFLAELRAQVWIEGNEPAEFGRYWVRYETDVGPQYCSAKWMEHNFCSGSDSNIHKIWLADHSRSINSLRGVTHYTKLPDSLESAK